VTKQTTAVGRIYVCPAPIITHHVNPPIEAVCHHVGCLL